MSMRSARPLAGALRPGARRGGRNSHAVEQGDHLLDVGAVEALVINNLAAMVGIRQQSSHDNLATGAGHPG